MDNAVYAVWLANACGIGSRRLTPLYARFGDARQIYEAESYDDISGLPEEAVARLENKDLTKALSLCELSAAKGVTVLAREAAVFPPVCVPSLPRRRFCMPAAGSKISQTSAPSPWWAQGMLRPTARR